MQGLRVACCFGLGFKGLWGFLGFGVVCCCSALAFRCLGCLLIRLRDLGLRGFGVVCCLS